MTKEYWMGWLVILVIGILDTNPELQRPAKIIFYIVLLWAVLSVLFSKGSLF